MKQVVLDFPGWLDVFRLIPERGKWGIVGRGLGDESPLIFCASSANVKLLLNFPRYFSRFHHYLFRTWERVAR